MTDTQLIIATVTVTLILVYLMTIYLLKRYRSLNKRVLNCPYYQEYQNDPCTSKILSIERKSSINRYLIIIEYYTKDNKVFRKEKIETQSRFQLSMHDKLYLTYLEQQGKDKIAS